MNMLWIMLLIIFMVWNNIKIGNVRKKTIINIVRQNHSTAKSVPLRSYTSDQLKQIGHVIWTQHRRNIPDHGTIRNVKNLRINRRRIRLNRKELKMMRRLNLDNLSELQKDPERPDLSCRNRDPVERAGNSGQAGNCRSSPCLHFLHHFNFLPRSAVATSVNYVPSLF